MREIERHLDAGSRVVILITFALFAIALFVKGFGHEILLEAGVFLVSVKLIIMAYKISVTASVLIDRLDKLDATVARIGDLVEPGERYAAPGGTRSHTA